MSVWTHENYLNSTCTRSNTKYHAKAKNCTTLWTPIFILEITMWKNILSRAHEAEDQNLKNWICRMHKYCDRLQTWKISWKTCLVEFVMYLCVWLAIMVRSKTGKRIVRLGEELLTDLILLAVHGVMLSSTSETAAFATVGTVEEVHVIFHNTPARTVSCLAMEAATAKSTLQTKQLKLEI